MLRVLATRRWLGALLLAAAFAVAAFHLGQWQWGRYQTRDARAERITSHYDAPPTPLGSLTPQLGTEPLARTQEWTRVTMTGTYAATDPLLVRNRPYQGTFGYEVINALDVAGMPAPLVVDRGWVQNADRAADLPTLPPTPAGSLQVTGWLRVGEPTLNRSMPSGQLASINLTEAGAALGRQVLGAYLILEVERSSEGSAPARPTPLEPPDTDLGPHQAYAFQWWGAMPAGFALVFFGIRREVFEGEPEDLTRPVKPKKVRIWDEEDG